MIKQKEELLNPDSFIENEKYEDVSSHLSSFLSTCKTKRQPYEQKWIRNQAQYDSEYEKEILDKIKKGRSRQFNPVTQKKVKEFVARTTELVLPNGDKNFALYTAKKPNLPLKKMQEILNGLKVQAASDPNNPKQVTMQDLEQAAFKVATESAKKMEETIFDQLISCNYKGIIKKTIHSGAVFGFGVAKGPVNITKKQTVTYLDDFGNIQVKEKEVQFPSLEVVKPFDCYFDLDAKEFGKDDGAFFSHIYTKNDFAKLMNTPGFIKQNIKDFLYEYPEGNYTKEPYELQLESNTNQNIQTKVRKYRVYEYWGTIPRQYLEDIMEDLPEDMEDIEVNIWMANNIILKCILNPYKRRPYHVFPFTETDNELLPDGLVDILETEQRAINAVTRAIHNHMPFIAEPTIELNTELLPAGANISILEAGMVIKREGTGNDANYPAVRKIELSNGLSELMALERKYRENIDDISNLSAIMSGDLQGQATLGRTSSGINSLMGAANITLREFARMFDFFNESIISLMIQWNEMFNDDESIKGDFQVFPRVSTALVEKQITANNLNNFVVTMTDGEKKYANYEAIFDARLRANNLDPDLIKLSPEQIAAVEAREQEQFQMQQQMMMEQQQLQASQIQADVNLKNSKAQVDLDKISQGKDKLELDRLKTLSGVEKSRGDQELKEMQFKNQMLNEDQELANLTKEDLLKVIQLLQSKNPNLNIGA